MAFEQVDAYEHVDHGSDALILLPCTDGGFNIVAMEAGGPTITVSLEPGDVPSLIEVLEEHL